ncbi:MAG TPA: hypothetical protein VI589_09660, partial [Vicinamibacteria bacterium]
MRWAWTGLGLLAVFLAPWVQVPATNFSGWDEWLVVNLTSRGVLNLPYENRPFSLLFNLPGALLLPFTLAGFWLVHAGYVVLAGALTSWLVRRLGVEDARIAFMAGAFAVSFAPLDAMRLDVVLLANYSGAAFAVVLVLALLVEAERRADDKLALLAGLLGFMAIRSLESSAALLAAAPLLPLMAMPAKAGRLRRALLYAFFFGVGLALAVRPLLPGQAASYQVSGLGFDPHPGRLLGRMAQLLALHLAPLVRFVPAELGRLSVLVAVAAFLAVWSRLGMPDRGDDASTWRRPLLVGVAGAVLAMAVLALSPANVTPWRTQILSAPFVGMALAAGLGGLARWKPGRALCPLLAGWVVAIGASRVLAMQADWDRLSYWPRQSGCLRQLA